MKRLFIATKIHPSGTLINTLDQIRTSLHKERIAWTDPMNMHITYHFLGETAPEKIPEILHNIGKVATINQSFNCTIKGFGYFGPAKSPLVLWMGIEDKTQGFNSIHQELKQCAIKSGFMVDERPYRPHLTIGRIKRLNDSELIPELKNKFMNLEIQQFFVDSIGLYESKLSHSGPVYSETGLFLLKNHLS